MPDPRSLFEDVKNEGLPVHPLPVSEVRRRGDRLRHRNRALVAVGCAAVVAAVVAPLAAVGIGRDGAAPQPTPAAPATEWRHTVPGSFDIGAVPTGSPVRFTVRDASVVDDFTLCGRPTFSTGSDDPVGPATDTAGASYGEPGSDGDAGRTLAVYDDDRTAAAAVDSFRTSVRRCPEDSQGRGAPLVYAPLEREHPTTDSFVFTQQAQVDADLLADLTVVQVARVGNAVYVATEHTSAGGDQALQSVVPHLADLSAPVVDQMCVFAAEGCTDGGSDGPGPAESPAIGEGAVSAIPVDFPLGAGLPAGGRKGTVPSPELTSCGRTLPEPDTVEAARAQWRSPSEIRDRRLMTFSREADAQAYVESVAELPCGVEDLGGGVQRTTATYGGAPEGDFSALAVAHTEVDGRVDPGMTLTHVVRVGRAVLLTQRIDEAYTWPGDPDRESQQLVAESKDELRPVVEAMCTWTVEGC